MSKQMLLADDSITIQKVIALTFAGEDYKITAVDNGADAIEKAREIKPDIILADVMMPQKNGYEVCQTLKNDPELRSVPILLLAGTFEPFDEEEASRAGADGYIIKPFESQILVQKVKDLLQTRAEKPFAETAPAAPVPTLQVIEIQTETMPVSPVTPSPQPYISPVEETPILSTPAAIIQPVYQAATAESENVEDFWGTMMDEVEKKSVPMELQAAKPSEPLREEIWDIEEFDEAFTEEKEQEEDIWESFAFDDTEDSERVKTMEAPLIDEVSAGDELVFVSDEIPIGEGLTPVAEVAGEEFIPIDKEETQREQALEIEELESAVVIEPAVEPIEGLEGESVVAGPEEVHPSLEMPEVILEQPAVIATQAEERISEAISPAPEPEAVSPPSSVSAASFQPAFSEEQLRSALSQISKEIIERIVWEVVPDLAELLIKEEIKRLQGNK